jgi:hypothetical protein
MTDDSLVGTVWRRNDGAVTVEVEDAERGLVVARVVGSLDDYALDADDPRVGDRIDLQVSDLRKRYGRVDNSDDGVDDKEVRL